MEDILTYSEIFGGSIRSENQMHMNTKLQKNINVHISNNKLTSKYLESSCVNYF